MSDLQAEVVVSSWPWRLGTVVYDPVLGLDLAAWELQDLVQHPEWVAVAPGLLDPRVPASERGEALLEELGADQELLRTMYQLRAPEVGRVALVMAQAPGQELDSWLAARGLGLAQIELVALPALLQQLESWPAERHHELLADWWERWEIPHRAGPSAFRMGAGPGGSVYSAYGDQRLAVWQREISGLDFEDFSMWSALRVHWAWRNEFADQPWPGFAVLDQLQTLFSLSNAA